TPIRFCSNCPSPVRGLWPRTPELRPCSRLRLTPIMPGRRHGFRWQVREISISLSTDISSPPPFLPQLVEDSFPIWPRRPRRQVKALRKRKQALAPTRLKLQPKPVQLLRQVKSLTKQGRSAPKGVRPKVRRPRPFLSPLFCPPMTSAIG